MLSGDQRSILPLSKQNPQDGGTHVKVALHCYIGVKITWTAIGCIHQSIGVEKETALLQAVFKTSLTCTERAAKWWYWHPNLTIRSMFILSDTLEAW